MLKQQQGTFYPTALQIWRSKFSCSCLATRQRQIESNLDYLRKPLQFSKPWEYTSWPLLWDGVHWVGGQSEFRRQRSNIWVLAQHAASGQLLNLPLLSEWSSINLACYGLGTEWLWGFSVTADENKPNKQKNQRSQVEMTKVGLACWQENDSLQHSFLLHGYCEERVWKVSSSPAFHHSHNKGEQTPAMGKNSAQSKLLSPGTGRVLPNRLRILTHIIKGSLDALEAFLKVSHATIVVR